MAYLLDTGILLRLADSRDALHPEIFQAVGFLISENERLFTTTQNISEFWNVATRPIQNNGLALPAETVTEWLATVVEPACGLLVERRALYGEFKRLGVQYAVVGKSVHDARLVAMMLSWKIDKILTLNERDFRRYEPEGITVVNPASLPGN